MSTVDVVTVETVGGLCRGCRVGELGFEVGDTPVLEAQVGPRGVESLVEGAVIGSESVDALFKCGVLRGDSCRV